MIHHIHIDLLTPIQWIHTSADNLKESPEVSDRPRQKASEYG